MHPPLHLSPAPWIRDNTCASVSPSNRLGRALIATKLDDDEKPGPSITNMIECLANVLRLVSQRVTGYQHYGYGTSVYQPNGERETFDQIIFGSRRG